MRASGAGASPDVSAPFEPLPARDGSHATGRAGKEPGRHHDKADDKVPLPEGRAGYPGAVRADTPGRYLLPLPWRARRRPWETVPAKLFAACRRYRLWYYL
jgi:hypothetical protein